ncbi:hypothetical protein BB561_006299 [Smittium simulii]|uniref:Uncharacterized protein n=1 Tax=Smittium simulii TaxID=133385 RepID=A0A2T9Y5D2_9FUNG|nr:hypothetical protein BB561_006299 [Smittium simulii]
MSNGVLIPKGSSLSLNLFSKYHKPSQKSTPKNADNINPNTVPQKFTTKKSDPINLNIASQNDFDASCLVWGPLNAPCPFKAYALAQMKAVVCIILRKYYLFNKAINYDKPQSKYHHVTVIAANYKTLYLQKYKINNYQL